jgi:hypothetical protein
VRSEIFGSEHAQPEAPPSPAPSPTTAGTPALGTPDDEPAAGTSPSAGDPPNASPRG